MSPDPSDTCRANVAGTIGEVESQRLIRFIKPRYIIGMSITHRALSLLGMMLAPSAYAANPVPPLSADPLTVEVETGDADRFAALFERTGGKPSAGRLQRDYLDRGSYGIQVFTPDRIVDADNLAKSVAAEPDIYARAVRICLPIVKQTTAELRATYLALHGLFPDKPLPRLFLVVGAGNSGGTAGPGAQVLGLEVLCRGADTPDALRAIVRGFYAHETVHVLQGNVAAGNVLLTSVLQEGAADFIAELVTGRPMNSARANWAGPREAELWRQFEADLKATRGATEGELKRGTPAGDAFYRWIANDGSAPNAWPGEAGYWMGQRIWQRWYDQEPDKRAALREMLMLRNPEAVFAAGAFRTN